MNNIYFSNLEIIILVLLFIAIILPFRLINLRYRISLANPLIIYSLIFSYYCYFCPLFRVITDQTIERGVEFREFLIYGWISSLVSIISIYSGYFFYKQKNFKKRNISILNTSKIWFIGFFINIFGILILLIANGFNITLFNPFISAYSSLDFLNYGGAFSNYFSGGQDFLISGTFLMMTSFIKDRKKKVLTFLNLLITLALFLNQGFRYKLFFLTFPLFIFILISKNFKKIFYISFISISLFSFIFFNVFFETIRTYNGLNLSNLSLFRIQDIVYRLFNSAESGVFFITSGIIASIPEKIPLVYLYPIYKTITFPLPAALWPNKGSDHIKDAIIRFFDGNVNMASGAQVLNFGEYYLMFGWIGIIIGSFVLGFILKKLWIWVLIHDDEVIAVPLYLLNVCYIFIIISRGYLPQQFYIYAFAILPATITYLLSAKKFKEKLFKN